MPETEGKTSMFDTVKDHGDRIVALEEADRRHDERLRVVESNYKDLENTILKGNQSQQDFFRDTMNKQWELINARDKNKNEESVRRHDLAKTKLEKYSEIIIKVAGAGGILIVLAQLIFGN